MSGERGAASVLLLAVAVLLAGTTTVVVAVGQYLTARSQASAAADAAALAAAPVTFRPYGAAGTPAAEASRFAAANGARLAWCSCPVDRSWEPRTVVVEVELSAEVLWFGHRTVRARSRARFEPPRLYQPNLPVVVRR